MVGMIRYALDVDSRINVKHNVIVKLSAFLPCIVVAVMFCLSLFDITVSDDLWLIQPPQPAK